MNRRILAAVDDMIFASKIRGTAEQLNVTVYFANSLDAAFDAAKSDVPSLIILDLHSQRTDSFALAERFKADDQLRHVPVVAFFSHVQTELQQRARQSGIEHVMPRSAFTKRLPDILLGRL
ncbi:MAG: response regulator [Acidobacteria bacterium]|nr:response regulator [Acidobacteriota bacterium]